MLDNAYVKEYSKLPSLEQVLTASLMEASFVGLLTALKRPKNQGPRTCPTLSIIYQCGLYLKNSLNAHEENPNSKVISSVK